MALSSGAHVNIAGTDFMLEETIPDHYIHQFIDAQTFFSTQEAGPSVTHANLFHNVRYWYGANYEQGEGFQNWGTQADNDGYDQSYLNTRIPGQLNVRPARTDSSVVTAVPSLIAAVNAQGKMVVGYDTSHSLYWSTDGSTWTALNIHGGGGDEVQGGTLTSDGNYVYWVDVANNGIERTDIAGATSTAVVQTMPAHDHVLTEALGTLFSWDGVSLHGFDITTSANFQYTWGSKYSVFKVTDTSTTQFPTYIRAINADNQVILMSAWSSDTRIYSVNPQTPGVWGGSQLWQLPLGFTGRDICFAGGLLFVLGQYENRAAMFAMQLSNLQSTFVGYVRPWAEGFLHAAAVGPGSTIILAHSSEGYFVYDYLQDAFSALDYHYSDSTNSSDLSAAAGGVALLTYKGNRFAFASNSGGTALYATKWEHDLTNGEAGVNNELDTSIYFPTWDYGFVSGTKTLLGFELRYSPMDVGDEIHVQYIIEPDVDGLYDAFPSDPGNPPDNTWNFLCQQLGPTTPTNAYFDLTDLDLKFRKIKFRIYLIGHPTLYGWSAKVSVPPGQELFQLIVRLRDEVSDTQMASATSPSNRQADGSDLSNLLWGYARTKTPVTFKDGYPYNNDGTGPPTYDTYTVQIEEPNHELLTQGEGYMKVQLRRVDENSLG